MMKYKLSQNTISNEDIDALSDWLKTYPPLTMAAGFLTKQFEEEWSKKIGVKYSVFCNSGSSANLLAYSSLLSLYPDLKTYKTALSTAGWSTTLSPILQLGLQPVLCDVDENTFGMSTEALEIACQSIIPVIKLVTLVHTLGVPNDMDKILELQKKYGFLLMEDCCPAVGSKYKNRYVGTFGDISTFSFYYGHQISTIEGGMVCTNRKDIYEKLLMLRSHGWSKDLDVNSKDKLEEEYNIQKYQSLFTFYEAGYNLRSTEINAFLGLLQIKKLDEIVSKRNERFWYYHHILKDKFLIQNPPDDCEVSCITFPCITNTVEERKEIYRLLEKFDIETRPISGGSLGLQPIWEKYFGLHYITSFSKLLHYNGFVLPCHPEVSFKNIDVICNLIKNT
jgi:CDP-6-deoxy-D-xylo-4-hexulose-3-dehydrase